MPGRIYELTEHTQTETAHTSSQFANDPVGVQSAVMAEDGKI